VGPETTDNLDIAKVRKVLDEDHYGLEKVKKRILEYLAVRKLKQDKKGPILCLLGPPGVGKTSLGAASSPAPRPQVRAHLPRRRARRGRDPRPPPHLRRRAARPASSRA
jgi:ATP-dependent Lon protease